MIVVVSSGAGAAAVRHVARPRAAAFASSLRFGEFGTKSLPAWAGNHFSTNCVVSLSSRNTRAAAPHTAPRAKLRIAVLLSLSTVRTPGEHAARAIAVSSAWHAL